MQGWCRWPGLVWHKRVVCRVPQFPQLIPGLSALSGQHDPSSNVISFILYPAFCTYQHYIWHCITLPLHWNILLHLHYFHSKQKFKHPLHILHASTRKIRLLAVTAGCLLLFNFCQKYICKSYSITTCAKTYNLSSHKIVINYVRALSWGISQCIMFQYLIPYQLKERMGI